MKIMTSLIFFLIAIPGNPTVAAPEFLPLDAAKMRTMELESIPPFPAEIVVDGESKHWQKVLHQGDFVVALYEAVPAVIEINEPFPYDEFVLVLEGQVILSNVNGGTQTYNAGDTFLLPKGWMGTWNMPERFREMVVIDTAAWLAEEF